MHPHAVGDDRRVGAGAGDARLPQRHMVDALGDRSPHGSVEQFVLEEKDGIGLFDGRQQQTFGVFRRGGHHDLQPGHVTEPGFLRLRMERSGAQSAPERRPDRHVDGLAPAVVRRGQVVDDLIEGAGDEVRVLNLHHRLEALDGQTQRGAHRSAFDNGRVAHPLFAEAFDEPLGHLEHAPVFGDVLAHEQHAFVLLHGQPERLGDGVHEAQLPPGGLRRAQREEGRRKQIGPLGLGRALDLRLRQRVFGRLPHLGLQLRPNGLSFCCRKYALTLQVGLEAIDRVAFAPVFEQFFRHVLRARGFFVAPHAEGLHLQQRGALAGPGPFGRPPHRVDHGQHVVAVHDLPRHAVADGRVGHILDGNRLVRRCRKPVAVVFHHEDHGQLPDGRQVQRFVKVALARAAFARKRQRDKVLTLEPGGQAQPAGHGQHGGHVRDHADDATLGQAEVEGAIAPLREAAGPSHELAEERPQRHTPRGPHPQIAVHGHDVVALLQRPGASYRDRFLSVAAEPFGKAPLTNQPQHTFFDHPWQQQRPVERLQIRRRRNVHTCRRWLLQVHAASNYESHQQDAT